MRIIGGAYRGKKLISPQDSLTRPTSDRVRENLFNILSHRFSFNFQNKCVLDLFAGTGALGIEAISRGASHGTFVENHKPAIKILKENTIPFAAQASILEEDALKTLNQPAINPYDLILIDPPYETVFLSIILEKILENQWISDIGLIVVEVKKKTPVPALDRIHIQEVRAYGNTELWFLTQRDSEK